MKVLIIGGGGREHAIAWTCAKSEKIEQIFIAKGNGGTATLDKTTNIDIDNNDFDSLSEFALNNDIDITIVGPEATLADGIADHFRQKGLKIFAPEKKAAILESSKTFAKEFMSKYDIPTADFVACSDYKTALSHINDFGYPVVIKADGLAAGKGVVIADTKEEAEAALKSMMVDKEFSEAGEKVLIEKCLVGVEASLICLVDGQHILPLESAKDYKRIYDDDKGANTGGMGTMSPHPMFDDKLMADIDRDILQPFIAGVKAEAMDYRGVVFIGLMLTDDGAKVIEFNVRFGDPETQVVLPRLKTDFADVLMAVEQRRVDDLSLVWDSRSCVCVIGASGGYPASYEKGFDIQGTDDVRLVFHSGTVLCEQDNTLKTNGGRVLGVVGMADTLDEARKKAYEDIEKISFKGMQYRKDIGIIK